MLTVYSKDNCPGCRTAIAMIKTKGIEVEVLKLGADYSKEELVAKAPNARTVPQVFDGDQLIGGVPELAKYLKDK